MTTATQPGVRVLGRILVETGALDEGALASALAEQARTRERLGEVLVRQGTDPDQIARALARQLRMPYESPPLRPQPAALRMVDRQLAMRLRVLPMQVDERTLRVVMADPLDAAALDDLRFQTGRRIEPAVAPAAAIEDALRTAYGPADVQSLLGRIPEPDRLPDARESKRDEVGDLRRASEAAPVVTLVDMCLRQALELGASDVHVEPDGAGLRVRVRVDGELRELLRLPRRARAPIVSRLKVLAGLDIAVRRLPQDGRGSLAADGREVGLRVSTLPTRDGEKVVIRLLDQRSAGLALDRLGFDEPVKQPLEALLARRHGVILVTGPTGSGKTTTLYAALNAIDRMRSNIITLEDPVEYRLPGIAQVQMHRRAGLDFPTALRAVLRQDPDVIMVGEMRDRETVEVAMAAALTGHLVLSTLHTNDAASAVTRLLEMGAPAYLIAGGLIAVLAQRLVRRLCTQCSATSTRRPATTPADPCRHCAGSGYRGRIAVGELLIVDDTIRQLVLDGASADAIRAAARVGGMRTIAQHAQAVVDAGITARQEVEPVLAIEGGLLRCAPCGASITPDFVVCPACGTPAHKRCSHCGSRTADDWRWCAHCGRALPGPPGTSAPPP